MRRASVMVAVVLCVATLHARQSPTSSASKPSAAEIEQIVARYVESADAYTTTFRNLAAEETKLAEQFKKSGEVDKRRLIVSDLVVYQSSRDPAAEAAEYRDVRSVDGKPVKDRGARALALVQRASHADSLERELQVINRENQRYDLDFHIVGGTINQWHGHKGLGGPYQIEWVGREQVDGHDVIVLDYRSTKPCPKSSCNLANTGNIGITALFLQGRLWIDAASSQLRRERWEIAGVHQTLPERIVVVRKEATYGESRFGILTPRRIVCDYYDRTGGTKQKPSMALAARITFDYGEFRKFEVATEETIETPVEAAR